jgi:membrane complex biogenesis BtpA family protein
MVHLAPLPGSPAYAGDPGAVEQRALADARALAEAGFAGVVVENYGDIPFFAGRVPPVTVAALARVVAAVRAALPSLKVGVNCLRNDADAALAVAAACGAEAIRVNIHVGAALTDQGLIQGRAARTLRRRRAWGSTVRILADLRVKHAVPLALRPLEEEAADLRLRGLADALLITGSGTGRPADASVVEGLRRVLPEVPLFVASGVTAATAATWARLVDGAVIGSDCMVDGTAGRGVDPVRAASVVNAWREAATSPSGEA